MIVSVTWPVFGDQSRYWCVYTLSDANGWRGGVGADHGANFLCCLTMGQHYKYLEKTIVKQNDAEQMPFIPIFQFSIVNTNKYK